MALPISYDMGSLVSRSMLGGTSVGGLSTVSQALSYAGPILALMGAVQTGIGTYYSSESLKSGLEYQSRVSDINARLSELNARAAERTAQEILLSGEREAGRVSLKAGKVKSAQKVSQAARGVAIGEGSAAEEIATTDLMKEVDMLTINSNAVRAASAARISGVAAGIQEVSYENDARLKMASASGINSFSMATSSLLSSSTAVAKAWYQMKQTKALSALFGD